MNFLKNYLHRPFPNSFEEFKHALVSYSQFGEDLLVQEILGYERRDIFYIDIGAFHPINKSNTYIFYKRGGRGICVEPNPNARALWQKFRPRDIFVSKGATGGESGHLNYVTDPGSGAQNRFQTQSNYGSSLQHEIECLNIRQLVAELLPDGQSVDLLSVDCEGMDIDLIRNFPFDLVRPRVVVVEDFEFSEKSEIHLLLANLGYEMTAFAKITKIFLEIKTLVSGLESNGIKL
jgi:FkbM family methyltransferase